MTHLLAIIFAESQFSPPLQIGAWLGCLAFTMWIILLGKKLVDSFTGKDQRRDIGQPVSVQIVEKMHEQFAAKKEFDDLARGNTQRHSQIFATLDRVERDGRAALDRRMELLAEDRRKTLDHLNKELGFIRESIVAIQTELKIRNEEA